MSNKIVRIPWQPDLKLRESTLALLEKASDRYGARLQITRPDGALRTLARQLFYWLRYIAGLGPPASNPHTGPRYHMRGAAFDLAFPNTRARAACLAVGLIPDAVESWHFNDPNWASIPIVIISTASLPSTPLLPSRKDELMRTARLFYDKKLRVGYSRDLDADGPKIKCLGNVKQANYRIEANGAPGIPLSTSQIEAQVREYGIEPETADYIAWLGLPTGAVKPPQAV